VADDHHRLFAQTSNATDDGGVVGEVTITVQFVELGEDVLDVIQGVRATRMACQLGDLPAGQVAEDAFGQGAALVLQAGNLIADIQRVVVTNQALLQNDALVVVEGEVSNDDFSGGLRLRAKRVMSLEEARTGLADSLRVKVASEALKGDRLRWLAELCSKHKGACPVTLDYSGEEARALLQFGDAWRIDPADTLIQALRDQFGRDNVFLHYR